MKFALNVAALIVGVVVLWTEPVQSFSAVNRKLVLDVTANDKVWAKYLNVGVKFDKKTLPAAAHKVILGLNAIKAMSKGTVDPAKEPEQEQKPEQAAEITGEKGKEPEPEIEVTVVNALHVVVDVASHYNNHGVALEFALDTIATAIKCNTLMYILAQLHAIKETNDLQNDAISTQPQEVWHSLIHVLDKVAVLKKSFDKEFQLYQRWEVVASHDNTKELSPDFGMFMLLVEESLKESCELNKFEDIKKHLQIDDPNKWGTADKTMTVFSDCQKLLKQMFNDIPISTMNIKVWEIFLNKPEFKEQAGSGIKMNI